MYTSRPYERKSTMILSLSSFTPYEVPVMSLRNKLVSFSASVMHFLKDMPVSIKVTAYYTLFLGLLLLLVTMSGFQMAKYLEIKEMDKVLLEVTVRASRNEKAFDVYDRNVYLSIHNHEDKIVYGACRKGFLRSAPILGKAPNLLRLEVWNTAMWIFQFGSAGAAG